MVTNKNYKVKATVFVLFVAVIALSASTYARTETKYPEFEAECKVEIIGEPKLGEPLEVVFTFTPLVECYHTRGISDTAYLRSEKGVNYLKGDTVWTGFLQKGEQYSLRAEYVVDSAILFRFRGWVRAMEVVDFTPRPVRKPGYEQIGVKCFVGINSRPIDFRREEQKRSLQWIPVLQVTDTGLVLVDSNFVSTPPELVRKEVITWVTDSQPPRRKKGKLRTWEEAIQQLCRKPNMPIKLDSSIPDTIRITYDAGRAYVFVTDTSITSIEVELLDGKGEYKKIEEKKGSFRLDSDSAVFRVSAGEVQRVLIVKIGQLYWIDGDATYRDLYYNDYPIRHNVFHIYTSDDGEEWVWVGSNVTDGDGHLSFHANTDYVQIWLISMNALTDVVYADDHEFSPDDTLFWLYWHGVQIYNPGHGNVYVPDVYLRIADLWKSGAFSILDLFVESQDLISIELGASGLPDFTGTIWDDLDGTRETSCYNLFQWSNGVPGFYIASRANTKHNWDEWDLCVLCHEYAHHVMHHYMEDIPEAGGSWYYLFPTEGKNNLQLAMSEGWAHFFSAVVLGGPEFINSTVDSPLWVERNFEWPIPDPPYYNDISETDPLQPPWLAPQFEGALVPGAVVVSLWDLHDAMDDDDYYIDYVRWGHNNDHNQAEWWRGIAYIWDVLTNYDPDPGDPDHDHCWTIYEFLDGWRNTGYPVNPIFTDLLEAHNVVFFIPGDIDGNGGVNVGDLAYLVCYLFQDCQEPEPLSRADVNADCSVNVGDLPYLTDYLYFDGAEPLTGCVDLY